MLCPYKRPLPLEPAMAVPKRARTTLTVSANKPATEPLREPTSRSVVALLTLTYPSIVRNIIRLVPCESKRGVACVLGTLVNLHRAVAPFDHNLPRHFGPHNHVFWREMVLQSFDFTERRMESDRQRDAEQEALARWMRLDLRFRPSEYAFLSQLQQGNVTASWPEKEDAFTLFCDLALVVGKMRRVVSLHDDAPYLYPCILKSLGNDHKPESLSDVQSIVIPLMITRSSRRAYLTRIIVRKLRRWASVEDTLYVGRSKQSRRWLGFAVCNEPRSQHSQSS